MNTQPMDEYLNRERLTDLAQSAVPDGHDLWPKIERAARASASGITTPRPGILSLGLSRAWTAVGVLLIAASFAALGFGLAVLVLSNGHDQAPAAQPDATVTPTASPTPSVTEDAQSGQETTTDTTTSGTLEALLTGETLARYRTLPEEYQVALGAYSAFGVSDDLIPVVIAEKMAQWPDNPEPIRDLLDPDRYAEFQELTAIHPQLGDTVRVSRYAIFLLGYYPYVVQTEDTAEGRQRAFALLLDAIADKFSLGDIPQVPKPQLDEILVPSALAVLGDLGLRLQEAIRTRGTLDTVDVQTLAIDLLTFETMLLKTEPGLETPTLIENLSEEDQKLFMGLPEEMREEAERRYARGVLLRMWGLATSPDHPTTSLPDADVLTENAKQEFEVARRLAAQQSSTSDKVNAELQSILTGETLARYRTLPEEYQVALRAYSAFGVSADLIPVVIAEKMAQWPDNPEPIRDLLDPDRYAKFQELTAIHPQLGDAARTNRYAFFFLSYYPYVVQTEDTAEGRQRAFALLLDAIADKFSLGAIPQVPDPELADVIVPSAADMLDELGPRLREAIRTRRTGDTVDVQSLAIELLTLEVMLLKIEPGLETPTLVQYLSQEDQEVFEALPADMREAAEGRYARSVLWRRITTLALSPDYPTISLPDEDILTESAKQEFEFARRLAEQQTGTSSTMGQTPTTPNSWVSENGFIQFTTGDGPLDDPLPGTHEWCIPPTRPPEQPGPWLVPSKLPEGMEPTTRDQMFPHTMGRAFRSSTDRISMVQGLCATRLLSPVSYRSFQVGDRTAYVTAAVNPSTDGSAPQFDPNVARSLVMDIGYGTVEFNVFGSVTVEELVDMAASLVPEELTDAEGGPYPQAVLDALGTSFGPVYIPSDLPDGYEMFGQLQARKDALAPRTSRLSYVRAAVGYCVFRLNQAALRQQFPDVVQRAQRGDETSYTVTDETGQSIRATAKWGAVEIDGLTIYAQEFSAQPRNQFTDVYFQSQGVWFNLTINTSPYCNHSLKMVAEIASSLEPLQP